MAQLTVHGNWKSVAALASLFAFVGVLAFAVVAGESLGIWPYLVATLLMVFGFWSKEDHLAIAGIMGISLVLILDVLMRIGVLAFNTCHDTFSIWTGC